jgi:AAA domain
MLIHKERLMSKVLEFSDPGEYSKQNPIHIAIYGINGVGKTTFAGNAAKEGMKVTIIDCSDSGAITLRNHPKEFLKIIRVKNILDYLDIVDHIIKNPTETDILVVDTMSGLQSLALKEVKGKRNFEMNQRKWGLVGSRIIECIAETRNFPKDVIYLLQEKRSSSSDEGVDEVSPALTPSSKGYLSSSVDWVGRLTIEEVEDEKSGGVLPARFLDFRINEHIEVKDRATLFPKRIKNPSYMAIRKRIVNQLFEQKGE